jgi:hypothetical protein
MPCERKHIEAIRDALGRCDKYMPFGCGPEVRPFVDAYSAVADALEACDESPWRSMESAPQYEEVLLRSNGARVGIYTCPRKMMSHTEYEALLRQYPECADDEDWYGYTQDGPIILRDENCPTGWMPMPRGGS